MFDLDSRELAEEVDDLRALAEEEARAGAASDPDDDRDRFHTPDEEPDAQVDGSDVARDRMRAEATAQIRPERQTRTKGRVRSKRAANSLEAPEEEDAERQTHTRSRADLLDSDLQDKVTAVRFAFPQASANACGELLIKHNKDVSKAWKVLAKSLRPRQGLAETMVMATQLELPREVMIVSSPQTDPAGALGEVSRVDEPEEDDSSSNDEDESDSSDEESEEDNRNTATKGEDESDSDSDSDGTSDEASESSAQITHGSGDTGSSSSKETSSSESDSRPRNSSYKAVKRSATRISATGGQNKKRVQESSSESEASEPQQTSVRRSRKISHPSPPNRRGAKAPPKAAIASISSDASESGSDDESSSEDSSSDSSSESSSDSEDESTDNSAQPAKNKKMATSQSSITPNRASARSGPPPASAKSSQTPVPPGQGLTKTQKRNQRRRLHAQKKKEALAAGLPDAQDTIMAEADLEAKKASLLHALGTESNSFDQTGELTAGRDVSTTVRHTQTFRAAADEDSDAWKQKISYRAVEVVQEGIELSEPPFPFVQRWDPQQRWGSQWNSQRRGKRKSRGDSQFYDDPSVYSAKKRRFRQHGVNDYYDQEDATTFLGDQDVTLDYDDVSFNPDEGPMSNGYSNRASGLHRYDGDDQEDHERDDLPPLPKDMSSLPEFRAPDLKTGVIIAYKQLLCTEATNWQPQMSDFVTAAVTQIYDGGNQEFQVQLAKRDRNVDRNEKKYDEETGQRIYGKFEAPDEDEEEEVDEEDEGFRDVFLGQMIEARIVQKVNEIDEMQAGGQHESGSTSAEASQSAQLDFEVADSQTEERRHGNKFSSNDNSLDVSGTLDHETDRGHSMGQALDKSYTMGFGSAQPDVAMDESFVSETNHDINADDQNGGSMAAISPVGEDGVSIAEDRRGEISQLINDGGFRLEVSSSIDQSSFLRSGGSPSRQLEEEMQASVLLAHQVSTSRTRTSSSSDGAPSEYGSKEPSQLQETDQPADRLGLEVFHSVPQTPSVQKPDPEPLNVDGAARQMLSTEKINYPKPVASQGSQTTQTTEQSAARQLDPNFITSSDDLGIELPEISPSMANGFEDDTASPADYAGGGRARTPKQQVCNDDLQDARTTRKGATPFRSTRLSPAGSARSAGSTGSSSIFTDIELLGSQPVLHKRKSFSPQIKDESAGPKSMDADEQARSSNDRGASKPNQSIPSLSPAPRTRTSSGQGKETGVDGFKASISPPALSRLRRKPDPTFLSTASSQNRSSGDPFGSSRSPVLKPTTLVEEGATKKGKASTFIIPKGSQVISLLSSPAPESDVEAEPESLKSDSEPESESEPLYTEMYADESVDGDYDDDAVVSLPRRVQPRRASTTRNMRGASVPVAERHEAASLNWVSGSQGPSRKASGRFGGRFSTGGF